MKTPIRIDMFSHGVVEFQMDLDGDNVCDVATAYCCNREGTCEPAVTDLLMRAIRPGDVAVDVGANIGFFTLLMARLAGEKGKVLAFEPCPQNLPKLEANIRLNAFTNVDVIGQALWSSDAEVTLWMQQDGGAASLGRAPEAMGSLKVQAMPLERKINGFFFPRLVKIDAEGAEYNILVGAGDKLHPATIPYVICEINEKALKRLDRSGAALRTYMRDRGYDMFLIHDTGQLPTFVPYGTALDSTALNLNVLFSTLYSVSELWPIVQIRQNAA